MAIYTRKGDKGKTFLANGKKVSKSDIRVEAYGTIDELNSALGVCLAEISDKKKETRRELIEIQKELVNIQCDLMNIASSLANPSMNHKPSTINYLQKRVKEFEDLIDEMTEKIPKLSNFILPGGRKVGAKLHLIRAVCRRVERRIVFLAEKERKQRKIDRVIIVYINRLSDLLFTMARFANFKEKVKEEKWSG